MREALSFVEAKGFTSAMDRYFASDEDYADFQNWLAEKPDRGPIIPGAGPLRKVRWEDARRGKGKRGGIRVIYLHVPEAGVVGLIDVYGKDDAEDIPPAMKPRMRASAAATVDDLKRRYGKESTR